MAGNAQFVVDGAESLGKLKQDILRIILELGPTTVKHGAL